MTICSFVTVTSLSDGNRIIFPVSRIKRIEEVSQNGKKRLRITVAAIGEDGVFIEIDVKESFYDMEKALGSIKVG